MFEAWGRPELHIVAEVADGLQAVQKAEELQPDIIVMDTGLPSLNGIEAARRIRSLCPESKILFLSQGTSADVVRALKAGNSAIVVATELHRDCLLPRLEAHGVDVAVAIERGRYFSGEAADALSRFMINGMPDSTRSLNLFGNLIATAAEAAKGQQSRVAVFGEGVYLLWAQSNVEAGIEVEELCHELAKTYDVDILCGYSLDSVQGAMDSHIFQRICHEHSAVCTQ